MSRRETSAKMRCQVLAALVSFGVAVGLVLSLGGLGRAGQLPSPPAAATSTSTSLATLTYTRTLKGSVPEFLRVSVRSDGSGVYEGRALSDPSQPVPLQLSAATTQQLFSLANALGDFQGMVLESHKKVANLGAKTFTFEKGTERHEVEFNFTEQREARALTNLFEKVAASEEHIQALEYAIKYDPLSLPEELRQIQADLANRALADPELIVPSLEQIAGNPRFLHLAQVRAESILKAVREDR